MFIDDGNQDSDDCKNLSLDEQSLELYSLMDEDSDDFTEIGKD